MADEDISGTVVDGEDNSEKTPSNDEELALLEKELDQPIKTPMDVAQEEFANQTAEAKKEEDDKVAEPAADVPSEPTADEKADESADDTPEFPDLKEGQDTPVPSDWKRARSSYDELKGEHRALKQRLAQLEASPTDVDPLDVSKDQPQVSESDVLSNEEVLGHLVTAKEGLSGDTGQNQRIEREAQSALEELPPSELLELRSRVHSGGYGANTEIALQAINEALPVVQAKIEVERSQSESQERELQEKETEFLDARNGAVNKLTQQYPDLANEESDQYKAVQEWQKTYVGTAEKPGPMYKIYAADPLSPLWAIELVLGNGKAGTNGQTTPTKPKKSAMQVENERLKQQLESVRQGASNEGYKVAVSGDGDTHPEAAAAEKSLEDLGTIRPAYMG